MINDQITNVYIISKSELIKIFEKWRINILEKNENFDLNTIIVNMENYGERAADTFLELLNSLSKEE